MPTQSSQTKIKGHHMIDMDLKKIERLSTELAISTLGKDIINRMNFKRYSGNFLEGLVRVGIKIITINSKRKFI